MVEKPQTYEEEAISKFLKAAELFKEAEDYKNSAKCYF